MKNLILVASLLASICTAAQEVTILTGSYKVISLDGLNMRMNPDLQSVVLTAIPYQAEVEVLENRSYGELQVGAHKMCNSGEDVYELPIKGHWLSVSYHGKQGFVFSGFLLKTGYHWRPDAIEGVNEDYVLLFPGQFCRDNLPQDESFSWYGAYQQAKGEITIRSIEPSFSASTQVMTALDISFGNNCNLLFVIGTKGEPLLQSTKGVFSQDRVTNYLFNPQATNRMLPDTWLVRQSERVWAFEQGDIKQELSVPGTSDPYTFVHTLLWHGDIDGDGEEDYIFQFGEKVSYIVLFVSSEAIEGQVAKPVAVFYTGYCC